VFENVFGKFFTEGEADTKPAGLALLVCACEGAEIWKRSIEDGRAGGFEVCFLEADDI
jgi:hypothetical protein